MKFKNMEFIGLVGNLETSLFVDNFIVDRNLHPDGSGTHFCIYKINENAFGTGHISEKELDTLMKGEGWMKQKDITSVCSYFEISVEDWMKFPFELKLGTIAKLFGWENVMGVEYYPWKKKDILKHIFNK